MTDTYDGSGIDWEKTKREAEESSARFKQAGDDLTQAVRENEEVNIVASALKAANDKCRSDIETGVSMPNDERKRKRHADALRQIAIASGMATLESLEGLSDEQIISGDFDLPKYSWKEWDKLHAETLIK